MTTADQIEQARKRTLEYLAKAHIVLTPQESADIEVADFALNDLDTFGLEIVVYINTDRCCAKELVMFPCQICCEHRHPRYENSPGKEETFRCRWGQVYLYVPGPPTPNPKGSVPSAKRDCFTVWHEVILNPGQQYTLAPDTLHWFQGGPDGAIVSEFSTQSRDDLDIFTDPEIQRV